MPIEYVSFKDGPPKVLFATCKLLNRSSMVVRLMNGNGMQNIYVQ